MEPKTYLTKTDLGDRGWKSKSIKYFLASPDKAIKNARKSLPTQLYSLNRVIEIENNEQFKIFNETKDKQKNTTKISSKFNWANTFEINVPIIEKQTLFQKSCQYWHTSREVYYLERKRYNVTIELPDYTTCDKLFLNRISIEYLKHLVTCQNPSIIRKKTSIGTEKDINLQIYIYKEISKAYLYLAQECEDYIVKLVPI